HRRARAGSRPAHGRSTGRRRRCTYTTGTAPLDQPLPSRAPPLRRRDGFLAFLVGLGDGPRVGHVTPLRPRGSRLLPGPSSFLPRRGRRTYPGPPTWTSTPPISADPDGRLHGRSPVALRGHRDGLAGRGGGEHGPHRPDGRGHAPRGRHGGPRRHPLRP